MAARWEAAKEAQATYYNARHKPQEFSIGQLVLLSARNIRTRRPNKKLDHRWLGPFEVEAIIGKQAYRLKLPTSYKAIHPVFHVSCLEPYQGSARAPQGQPAQLVEGEEEWVVEKILAERGSGRDKQYLVRWEGYPPAEDTWEPKANLDNAKEALEAYERERRRQRQR